MADLNLNFNTNFGGNFKIDYSPPGKVQSINDLQDITINDEIDNNLSTKSFNNYNYNDSVIGTETMNFSTDQNSKIDNSINKVDRMTDEEIDSSIQKNQELLGSMFSTKETYTSEYNDIQTKYADFLNDPQMQQACYEDGNLVYNPITGLPQTPTEYDQYLSENFPDLSQSERENRVKEYTTNYNDKFNELFGTNYENFQELNSSYKSDMALLNKNIYKLENENIKLEYQKELNTKEFEEFNQRKKNTFDDLEKNYSDYISKSLNNEFSQEIYDNYNPIDFIDYASTLAEKQNLDKDEMIEKLFSKLGYDLKEFNDYYQVMTDDEKNLYSYLFETKGRQEADKYYNAMKDTWNQRIGYNEFLEEIKNLNLNDNGEIKKGLMNVLQVHADGIEDGIKQSISGIINSIMNNKELSANEYKALYYLSYLEENKLLESSYKLGSAVGNMLPSLTASSIVAMFCPEFAPKIGQLTIGISSFGNSKHQQLTQGYDLKTSIIYGIFSAGSEVLSEKFGGISGIADKAGSNMFLDMFNEGTQEAFQAFAMEGIDSAILGKPIDLTDIDYLKSLGDSALESFLTGAFVAGELNIGKKATFTIIENGKKVTLSYEEIKEKFKNSESLGIVDQNTLFLWNIIEKIQSKFNKNIDNTKNSSNPSDYVQSGAEQTNNSLSAMATESPDIDSIIKKMTNNGMSYEEAVSVLAEYYNTKDSSNLPNYIQSEAKQINNTDLETYLTFLSEDVSTISMDSVINSMYNSGMSYEEIISTLANYYNTGDINYIPSNLRVEFQNIPASDLETYLSRIVNNSKNKNVDISKKATFTPAKKVENLTEFYQQLKSEISSDDRFLQFYNITEKSSIPTNLREAISYIPSSDLRSYVNGIVKNPNFTSSNANLNNLVNYLKSTGMSINEIQTTFQTYVKETDDIYSQCVRLSSESLKKLPTVSQVNEFKSRFENDQTGKYWTKDQGLSFRHYGTKTFNMGKIDSRIYINADYDTTFDFLSKFATKCDQQGIPFYFKTGVFDTDGVNVNSNRTSFDRDESAVIYTNKEYVVDYINICNEIRNENPNMQFFDPPAMTASYNGWLGFGEEPNTKGISYNEVRSLIIGEAMQNVKIKMKKLNIEMNEINFVYIKTEFLKEVARLSDKYGVNSNIEYFWKSK